MRTDARRYAARHVIITIFTIFRDFVFEHEPNFGRPTNSRQLRVVCNRFGVFPRFYVPYDVLTIARLYTVHI